MAQSDSTGSPAVHRHFVEVGFGHCDPAGIVYFPRYFEWFHEAMESWFRDALGVPYVDVIVGRKIGFPSVHTEADFRAPSRMGDRLAIELRLGRLGNSSVTLEYQVRERDDENGPLRVQGKTVVVVLPLDAATSEATAMAVPADLRDAIVRWNR